MEIHFATTNPGKLNSLRRDLGKYGIKVVQDPTELIEPRSSDVKEIAESKIKQAYCRILAPTIVVDAGFYIDSLNGFPRAFPNFALDTIGIEGILKLLEGKDRKCEFRECLAYLDDKQWMPQFFFTYDHGTVADRPRGRKKSYHWSELSTIFIPNGSEKTHAEMSKKEYMAFRKLSKEKTSLGQQLYDWLKVYRL